jgi:hypothetical protein
MYDPHERNNFDFDELDEVDRIFARLDRAPVPQDLTARVLASTVARTNATRAVLAWPWMIAGLAALGALTIAGYQVGANLAATDGLDLIAAIFGDLGLLTTAPGDVFAALGEVIPWTLVVAAGLSAALLIVAVNHLVARGAASLGSRRFA